MSFCKLLRSEYMISFTEYLQGFHKNIPHTRISFDISMYNRIKREKQETAKVDENIENSGQQVTVDG